MLLIYTISNRCAYAHRTYILKLLYNFVNQRAFTLRAMP